jgi:hypothetical protein
MKGFKVMIPASPEADPDVFGWKASITKAIGGEGSGGQGLAIRRFSAFCILNGFTLNYVFSLAYTKEAPCSMDVVKGISASAERSVGPWKAIKRFSEYLKWEKLRGVA